MLLVPLFVTSFLIDDFLADEGFFGADVAILSSASSKTALALAFLLGRREVEVVGLTSPGRVGFVEGPAATTASFPTARCRRCRRSKRCTPTCRGRCGAPSGPRPLR